MSEHDEQVAVVEWCDLNGIPVFAMHEGFCCNICIKIIDMM